MYKNLDKTMILITQWQSNLRKEIKPIVRELPYMMIHHTDCLAEAVKYRFIELIESSFCLYKNGFFIGSLVSARAALETLSILMFINIKLDKFKNGKDVTSFVKFINEVTYGWSPSNNDKGVPKTKSITKYINESNDISPIFIKMYDELSEYAHPNYCGTSGVYRSIDKRTHACSFKSYNQSSKILIQLIEKSLCDQIKVFHEVIEKNYNEYMNSALDVFMRKHKAGNLKSDLEKAGIKCK